jgi:hypothetical protein
MAGTSSGGFDAARMSDAGRPTAAATFDRSPIQRGRRPLTVLVAALVVAVPVAALAFLAPSAGLLPHGVAAPTTHAAGTHFAAASGSWGSNHYQCDGMYWKGASDWYTPSYCYGHDEPTMSFISNAPASGEDATFRAILPVDGSVMPQGNLYAALWFGGAVRDPNSTGGGGQAFLELQFYPAAPIFTGAGSGKQDCLPNGAFNPNQSAASLASSEWFSCAVVWQLVGSSENAAFAGPMDVVGSTDAILVMHSGDPLTVTYAGTAQSATQGWNLTIVDAKSGQSAKTQLNNGTLALSPYYATAARGNTLSWGASSPGAVAFAYEIGHTLNTTNLVSNVSGTCDPGDQACDSYWPGKWLQSGQMQIQPPLLGSGSSAVYPTSIGFSSSQGGEAEVNATSCLAPSSSTLRNCMYPYYQYQAANYSFTFGTSAVANDTYDYGSVYQFPGNTGNALPGVPVIGGVGFAQNVRYQAPPIGGLVGLVAPAKATVDFNPVGSVHALSVGPSGEFSGQFLEGLYWLNISKTGCTPYSHSIYLKAGTNYTPTVALTCSFVGAAATVAPNPVTAGASACYTSLATGGKAPYTYLWTFTKGSTSTLADPCFVWNKVGTATASLTVTDAKGGKAVLHVPETVVPNWILNAAPENVTVYGNNVSVSGTSIPTSYPMSTTFPTGQSDINAGYLFPGPVSPVTWTFHLNNTTAGPIYLDENALATAHFFVSLATPVSVNGTAAVAPVSVTIIAQLDAGSTIVGVQPQTRNLSLNGNVTEYNISFSPEVAFIANPSPLTLSFTWYEASSNGEPLSSQVDFHSGAKYPIGVTLPMLAPVLVAPPSVTVTSATTAQVKAMILSPFGTYDLGLVTGKFNGIPVSPVAKGALFTWKLGKLTVGTVYSITLTAVDQQGQAVSVTLSWTQ